LENADLCDKIHQERQICIAVKVQNRMMQQRNLELSGYGIDEQFFWSACLCNRRRFGCVSDQKILDAGVLAAKSHFELW